MLPKLESYSVRIFGVGNLHFVGRGAGEALQAICNEGQIWKPWPPANSLLRSGWKPAQCQIDTWC